MASKAFAFALIWLISVSPLRAQIRVVTGRDIEEGPQRPVALEFLDAQGQVKKRLALEPDASEDMLGARDSYDARLCGSGRVLVLTHWRRDPWQRNPYAVRRALTTEISWYDDEGRLLGRRSFPARAQVAAVSKEGELTVVVEAGFERADFEVFNDVPWIRSTDDLAHDHELIDHRIYAVKPTGELLLTRTIVGPEVVPAHVEVSPSGRWFVYKLDSYAAYVDDVRSGVEERFAGALPIYWRVNDAGELYGYQPKTSGQSMKYVRKPGADHAVAVEVTSAMEP